MRDRIANYQKVSAMTAKLILAASLSVISLLAQKAPQGAPAPKPAASKSASGLPAGAEKIGDGVYRAKDSAGKAWIYTQTPFGYSRAEDGAPSSIPARSTAGVTIRAIELTKDTARFERDTPFGKSVWSRPLDKLTEAETAALETYKNNPPKVEGKK